jgi:hypothetical protein
MMLGAILRYSTEGMLSAAFARDCVKLVRCPPHVQWRLVATQIPCASRYLSNPPTHRPEEPKPEDCCQVG